jgi:hypothetical protein
MDFKETGCKGVEDSTISRDGLEGWGGCCEYGTESSRSVKRGELFD